MKLFARKPPRRIDVWEAGSDALAGAIRGLAADESTQRVLLAVVGGGVYAARCALQLDTELLGYWSATSEQVVGVVRIFSADMLSRWIRKVWVPRLTPAQLVEAKESWSRSLITLFGKPDDQDAFAAFRQIDVQFNADTDFNEDALARGQNVRFTEHALVMGLAGAECGRPTGSTAASLQLPVDDWRGLADQGWTIVKAPGLTGAVTIPNLLLSAEALMYEIYARQEAAR